MVVCQEALVAARRGNYGVGAVLVNPRGTVVARGQNAVFYPHFARLLAAGVQTVKFLAEDAWGGMVNHDSIRQPRGSGWGNGKQSARPRCQKA
jgi:hypothetical protein